MWCTQECWNCNDKRCEFYSNILDESGHSIILKNLELKYLGRKTSDNTKIIGVEVDYRKDHQYMNRVQDEYGNIFYISELESEE